VANVGFLGTIYSHNGSGNVLKEG